MLSFIYCVPDASGGCCRASFPHGGPSTITSGPGTMPVFRSGPTWIAERSFAWLGRNRRLSKDYEYRVQTSELMIDLAATRLMFNRLASR
jgi:hypothetical protein